jgi:predicted phage tail protein
VNYEFQVSKSSLFRTILQSGSTTETQTTLGNLDDGRYYWRVRSINAYSQIGSWSSTRSFIVDNVAPPAPRLYLPGADRIYKGTPSYSWYAVTGGFFYQFRYMSMADEVLYTSAELKVRSHKPPVQPLGSYKWQARARDAAGNWSGWSVTRNIEIIAPVPAAPKLLEPAGGSATSDTTPRLDWTDPAYAVGYNVQIALDSGFKAIIQNKTINSVSEYTADPLSASVSGATYFWRVRSVNVYDQKGSWSAYRSIKIIP